MEVMGLIAIIVNCYLIGQCGQLQRLFPWLSPEMAIISIVILEVRQTLRHHQLMVKNIKICDHTVFKGFLTLYVMSRVIETISN